MTIREQLEKYQPEVYNFLIKCFNLDFEETKRKEPINYIEDDPYFRKYKYIMEEKKGVSL